MKETRNWIIGSSVLVFVAFAGKSLVTGEGIPDGVLQILVLTFGAGLGAEPLKELTDRVLNKKKEGDK